MRLKNHELWITLILIVAFIAGAVFVHSELASYEARVSKRSAELDNSVLRAIIYHISLGAQLLDTIWFKPLTVFTGGLFVAVMCAVPLAFGTVIVRAVQLKRMLQRPDWRWRELHCERKRGQ